MENKWKEIDELRVADLQSVCNDLVKYAGKIDDYSISYTVCDSPFCHMEDFEVVNTIEEALERFKVILKSPQKELDRCQVDRLEITANLKDGITTDQDDEYFTVVEYESELYKKEVHNFYVSNGVEDATDDEYAGQGYLDIADNEYAD